MKRVWNQTGRLIAFVVALAATSAHGENAKDEPDLSALAKTGRATLDRLQKDAASWDVATEGPNGSRFVVEVVAAPNMRRLILSIEVEGRRQEVLRLIVRDGIWYATEGPKAGKYRPFEAPFDWPTAYLYLSRVEPRSVVQRDAVSFGTYQGTREGIATYHMTLPEAQKRQLQNVLTESERLIRKDADEAAKREVARARAKIQDLVDNGLASRIDLASGMIVQYGAPDRQTHVNAFRWRDRVDPQDFEVEAQKWVDYTDDPTAGGTDDLVVIGHCGIWRPGGKSPEIDGRLLDLRSGRFRRIPFRGAVAQPGCFLKDRTRVIISGLDGISAALGLYEIDLKTGANRPLGGDLLANGITMFPCLSPDGKTIAALHRGVSGRLLDTRVCLVDVTSGAARLVGQPHDMAFPSWLPDGKGLVLLAREAEGTSGRTKDTIARMDLKGDVTKLRDGGFPVLVGDGTTVLFQDSASHTWQMCDLDGGHVRPYADGLNGYGFPTVAPDGKRLMMMHFQEGKAPVPTVLTVGDASGKPATTVPGLWGRPAWR